MGGRPEIALSLKAQCSQLLHWTGVWALELLSNETVEGLDHASVHSSIVGPDADGELSPRHRREGASYRTRTRTPSTASGPGWACSTKTACGSSGGASQGT